jgi:hypothetical protein
MGRGDDHALRTISTPVGDHLRRILLRRRGEMHCRGVSLLLGSKHLQEEQAILLAALAITKWRKEEAAIS